MPLVPQQNVIVLSGRDVVGQLKAALDSYPPVRIISLSTHVEVGSPTLIAVIETV